LAKKWKAIIETTLDRFGRILIPKRVRDGLGLKPGAVLEIEEVEQKIFLKPIDGEPHVVTKDGVLVFSGTATGDIVGVIRAHRKERLSKMVAGTGRVWPDGKAILFVP
jgi:AbrB family looped-hinge helix DNA binding protein